jgi:hypothetical protein
MQYMYCTGQHAHAAITSNTARHKHLGATIIDSEVQQVEVGRSHIYDIYLVSMDVEASAQLSTAL